MGKRQDKTNHQMELEIWEHSAADDDDGKRIWSKMNLCDCYFTGLVSPLTRNGAEWDPYCPKSNTGIIYI
jgi:hypothetical protein